MPSDHFALGEGIVASRGSTGRGQRAAHTGSRPAPALTPAEARALSRSAPLTPAEFRTIGRIANRRLDGLRVVLEADPGTIPATE